MTVAELIAYLQKQPQDIQVGICMMSEYCLLDTKDIHIQEECPPRPDGWIQRKRPDKPTQTYLMFPGN